jgi:hypothetical protein
MSLNEIFTSWKIVCLPHTAPLKEKLEVMTKAAKTNTLRNRLNQLIANEEIRKADVEIKRLEANGQTITPQLRQQIRNKSQENESVEIYLNYETELKERLDLLSVIETMSYREIGKRSWIDEKLLIEHVNQNFYEELYKLPLFEEVFKKENSEEIAKIEERFMEKLQDLGECPKGVDTEESVLTFKVKQGQLMAELEEEKRRLAINWYKKIIGSN